jgi:HKD family nuclease
MKLEVLGPGPKSLDLKPLGWYMERHLANVQQNGEFYVMVALSEAGALRLFSKNICRISRENGKVKAIIGIDLGTPENILDQITQIFGIGNVFVYHNPKASTFHPKMYIIKVDENLGIIIVGSSNLTSGGLFKNFEINLAVELDLQETEERKLFQKFSLLFEKLTNERSSHLLTRDLILILKSKSTLRKKALMLTKATRPLKLSDLFKGESHGWEITEFNGKSTFLMSLSYNDVSGVRGDQYIRIPVRARDANPKFWGWNYLFRPSPRAGNPERYISIKYMGRKKKRRLYFVERPDEFRLVMPEIYSLGSNFVYSILKICKKRRTYEMQIIPKTHPEYNKYLGWCTEKCPRGWARLPKVWGYV